MMTKFLAWTAGMTACLAATAMMVSPAHAYIGPGAGAGAIAITLALVVGLLLLVVALVWYPLKRVLKRRKKGEGPPKS